MKYLILAISLITSFSLQAQLSPAEVVDKQLKAYNERDIDAFLATYADHITVYEYGNPMPIYEGKGALRSSYGSMFEVSPNLNAYAKNRIVQGNKVIDHEIAEGIGDRAPIQVAV